MLHFLIWIQLFCTPEASSTRKAPLVISRKGHLKTREKPGWVQKEDSKLPMTDLDFGKE